MNSKKSVGNIVLLITLFMVILTESLDYISNENLSVIVAFILSLLCMANIYYLIEYIKK